MVVRDLYVMAFIFNQSLGICAERSITTSHLSNERKMMKLNKLENKNRRIRKKLYLGEFAILGFEVSCATEFKDFDQYDAFVDEFIDYINSIDLCFGGGGLELFEGFICSTERYRSVTEEEQLAVANWLDARSEVKKVEVSDLVDANYL